MIDRSRTKPGPKSPEAAKGSNSAGRGASLEASRNGARTGTSGHPDDLEDADVDSEQRKVDPLHLQTIDIPTDFRAQLVQAKPPVIPPERLLDTSPPNAGIKRPRSGDDDKQFDAMRLQSIEIPGEFRKQLVHAKPPVIPRERLLDTSAPGALEWKDGAPQAEESGERRREPAATESERQPERPRAVMRFGVVLLIGAAVVGVFVWWSRSTRSTTSEPAVPTEPTAAATHTEQAPAAAAPLATTAETPRAGATATAPSASGTSSHRIERGTRSHPQATTTGSSGQIHKPTPVASSSRPPW